MADQMEMDLRGVDNANTAYRGDNTDSYAKSIEDQYNKIAAEQATAVNDTVNEGVDALNYLKNNVAPQLARENLQAARADRAEAIERRDGIEVNNGNRQRIGHSQYDIADNTYDVERENIFEQQRQLELDLTRQIADLRAKGQYAKADAALQNAQQKFKQLYADQMRADKNLRSNYEYGTGLKRADDEIARDEEHYQTGLKREDEKIARDEERTNTKWLRSLGESFLQRGVMPSDGMLAAMGLDKETAQLYINAILGMYSYGGGGGGGRGGSGGSGGSGGGDAIVDTSGYEDQYTVQNKAYNNNLAKIILDDAKAGYYTSAQTTLDQAYMAGQFSAQNYATLTEMIDKYDAKGTITPYDYSKMSPDMVQKYFGTTGVPQSLLQSSSKSSGSSSRTSGSSGGSASRASTPTKTVVKPSTTRTTPTTASTRTTDARTKTTTTTYKAKQTAAKTAATTKRTTAITKKTSKTIGKSYK